MKQIIDVLYTFGATILGAGYDNALLWLGKLIKLDILDFWSGIKVGTWTVPDEWIVHEAWVKFKGQKIIDYGSQHLSLLTYSKPFKGKISKEELESHLFWSEDMPDATPYGFKFYDRDWGFGVAKNQFRKKVEGKTVTESTLEEGEYEVFIDTEFKPGVMKVGVHTIKGESDREILLFAHLDHPYQANDNLSGVACLTDLAMKIKAKHTIKIIFCPETIGSIAYASTQDISKVDFVIAVDICGNTNNILLQKAFDMKARVNTCAHLALKELETSYRKGPFRGLIGSDEYYFNDPMVGIPGIMLSTWPYKEYHTSEDTPEKINYEMIERVQKVIQRTIEIYEQDCIPKREFKGPLMRSRYGVQNIDKTKNVYYDYLFYFMDGKIPLSELCANYDFKFSEIYQLINKMKDDKLISIIKCQK
jgi:aminopeptidase-like protein